MKFICTGREQYGARRSLMARIAALAVLGMLLTSGGLLLIGAPAPCQAGIQPDSGKASKTTPNPKAQAPTIGADCSALPVNSQEAAAQAHRALVLSWNRQYSASINIYQTLVHRSPNDRALLHSLARVYRWAGQREDALRVEKRLQALDPSSEVVALAIARLELSLKQNDAAGKTLGSLLRGHPQDFDAHLLRARLDQGEGHLHKALEDYEWALGQNFKNAIALYGAAQIDYYLGRADHAYPLASRLVEEQPKDTDALLLLARIDRARGHRKSALALLSSAARLHPANSEVIALTRQIQDESAVTIHTTASYAREVAQPDGPGSVTEDLNAYGGAMRIAFTALPKSQSFVLLSSTPSNSPAGGIRGAVAPSELLYGQTTQFSKRLSVRGGMGIARMGPGEIFIISGEPPPARSVSFTPIAFGGASFLPSSKLRLDFAVSRNAITATPASVRLGATQIRVEANVSYAFDPRTRIRAAAFHEIDSAPVYDQANFALGGEVFLAKKGRDQGTGGSADITRRIIDSERLSLDVGYSGLVLGYAGERRGVFMGFFNPSFYQRHFATSSLHAKLWGPVDLTLAGDFGIQQVDQGQAIARAFQAGPAITFRLGRRRSITAGYLHYDFAQSLGKLKGNALMLSSDWSF
ncbi:MAG: tetratricopeptide repeat protein [Terriglobia bacterium]